MRKIREFRIVISVYKIRIICEKSKQKTATQTSQPHYFVVFCKVSGRVSLAFYDKAVISRTYDRGNASFLAQTVQF